MAIALIDTRAQVSTLTWDFSEEHRYKIHPVKQMIHLERTGGFTIPYMGYIEATVKIMAIKGYDECVPMFIPEVLLL